MASRYWGERNSDYQTVCVVHANCLCIVFGCTVKEAGSAESLTQGKWKLSEATPQGIGGRGTVITGQHMSRMQIACAQSLAFWEVQPRKQATPTQGMWKLSEAMPQGIGGRGMICV